MVAAVSLSNGAVVAFVGIMEKGLKVLGYSEPGKVIVAIVVVNLVAGLVGSVVYSTLLKKTKRYKLLSIICTSKPIFSKLRVLSGLHDHQHRLDEG